MNINTNAICDYGPLITVMTYWTMPPAIQHSIYEQDDDTEAHLS